MESHRHNLNHDAEPRTGLGLTGPRLGLNRYDESLDHYHFWFGSLELGPLDQTWSSIPPENTKTAGMSSRDDFTYP